MHIFVHTQHAPGINEMNIGQKTRLVAVCNYLAFHFPLPPPPPPLTAYYQRASLPPSPPISSLSVSEQEHRLILHSHFIFFFVVKCWRATRRPLSRRGGDYWCLATSEEMVKETKQTEGRAWQEHWAACMWVFFLSVFLFSCVKVLISVAGTVPACLICHAALSPRQNERKER